MIFKGNLPKSHLEIWQGSIRNGCVEQIIGHQKLRIRSGGRGQGEVSHKKSSSHSNFCWMFPARKSEKATEPFMREKSTFKSSIFSICQYQITYVPNKTFSVPYFIFSILLTAIKQRVGNSQRIGVEVGGRGVLKVMRREREREKREKRLMRPSSTIAAPPTQAIPHREREDTVLKEVWIFLIKVYLVL